MVCEIWISCVKVYCYNLLKAKAQSFTGLTLIFWLLSWSYWMIVVPILWEIMEILNERKLLKKTKWEREGILSLLWYRGVCIYYRKWRKKKEDTTYSLPSLYVLPISSTYMHWCSRWMRFSVINFLHQNTRCTTT